MQKSITSFFKKPAAGGVAKAKRTTALSPTAAKQLKSDLSSAASPKSPTKSTPSSPRSPTSPSSPFFAASTLAPEVRAKIEGNRAMAFAKRLSRRDDLLTQAGLEATLEPSWRKALANTLAEPFWPSLVKFVAAERGRATVYPAPERVFTAFNHSTFQNTRVVIIGQDPYHQPHQAHGMSFSVPQPVRPPPSLVNMYKELVSDIPGFKIPSHGCLEKWANQGVLMLNAVLTVRRGDPGSHGNKGWERFTDAVVHQLNHRKGPGVVFMLWGSYAKKKGARVNSKRHCVLNAVHPSPLSASRGWFGSRHFSQANAFLRKTGQDPIDWTL